MAKRQVVCSRMKVGEKAVIEKAADALGLSRSRFVAEAAEAHARRVLEEQTENEEDAA